MMMPVLVKLKLKEKQHLVLLTSEEKSYFFGSYWVCENWLLINFQYGMFNWEQLLRSLSSLFFIVMIFRFFFVLLFCFLREKFSGTLRILLSKQGDFSEFLCVWAWSLFVFDSLNVFWFKLGSHYSPFCVIELKFWACFKFEFRKIQMDLLSIPLRNWKSWMGHMGCLSEQSYLFTFIMKKE